MTMEETIRLRNITERVLLSPRLCAEQFRLYASTHPSKTAAHSLNFCADFLDSHCRDIDANRALASEHGSNVSVIAEAMAGQSKSPDDVADLREAAAFLRELGSSSIKPAAPLSEAAAPRQADWRPIAEANKSGPAVWAFNGEQVRMRWTSGPDWALWIYDDEQLSDICPDPPQPTHFMVLPADPINEAGESPANAQ